MIDMNTMTRPAILLLSIVAIVAAIGPEYTARPAVQGGAFEANSIFETVAALPLADTENILGTSDGTIYVTGMDARVVWKVTADRRVDKFVTVPSVAFVLGIAGSSNGFALTVCERPFRRPNAAGQPPKIDFADVGPEVVLLDKTGKITATIPRHKVEFVNGITPVGRRAGMYVVADSNAGTIWQVDAGKRRIDPWLKDDALAPTETARVGANGIHGGWVCVNSRGTMYRVHMGEDGRSKGALSVFAQGIRTDDFDIAKDGTIYLTSMTKVSPRGVVSPFLDQVPTGPAVMISRDGKWLYWPTRGGDGPQRLLRAALH